MCAGQPVSSTMDSEYNSPCSSRLATSSVPGFSLDDSDALRGTRTDMPVTWASPDLSALVGKPVYLRFEIVNMGLFSFRVTQE